MLTATIENANTLQEFYKQIRSQQEDPRNHGPHYCTHHDMIQYYMTDCESYKELGLHQGASAAAALLAGAKEVHLVDRELERYNQQKHIFEKHCEENNVKLNVYECDSIDPKCAQPTDMLMIDSYHKWEWATKELKIHAPVTKKYIIFHDTWIVNNRASDIGPGLKRWCQDNSEWTVLKESTLNVGSMIIKRVKN